MPFQIEQSNPIITMFSDDVNKPFYVTALSDEEIINHLKPEAGDGEHWLGFLRNAPGINSLAHNALFLPWIKEYFIDHALPDDTNEIYPFLFQQWFTYQKERLTTMGLLNDYEGDFVEHCWVYTHAVALRLNSTGMDSIDFDGDAFSEGLSLDQWERFFSPIMPTTLVRQGCPWCIVDNEQLSLYHPDIVKYFAGLTIYDLKNYLYLPFIRGDEGLEPLCELLDREVLQADSGQLNHFVSGILVGDISKDDYFRLVYLSAKEEKFARIAANAITILNYARVSFSGLDLSYIDISGADLSESILDHTLLNHANLTKVILNKAFIRNADLSSTCLKNIKLGEYTSCKQGSLVTSLSFHPSNKYLISSNANQILIWDLQTKKLKDIWEGHTKEIIVQFHPQGNLLASASTDKTIRIWEFPSGNTAHIFIGHSEGVRAIQFSNDGIWLASGSYDGTIRIWDMSSYCLLYTFEGYVGDIDAISFSRNRELLAAGSDNEITYIWDSRTKSKVHTLECKSNLLVFSPTSDLLATANNFGAISLWNTVSWHPVRKIANNSSVISSICFSEDGVLLASLTYMAVQLWDIESGNLLNTFEHTELLSGTLSFSPDNKLLAIGNFVGNIYFHDIVYKEIKFIYSAFDGIGTVLYDSHSNTLIITKNNLIQILDLTNKQFCATLKGHTYQISTVKIDSINKILTSIQLYHSNENFFTIKRGVDGAICNIDKGPDGSVNGSVNGSNRILIWSLDTFRLIHSLTDDLYEVNKSSFVFDKKYLISMSADNSILLWDISSGKILHRIENEYFDKVKTQTIFSYLTSLNFAELITWDIRNRKLPPYFYENYSLVVISPDHKILAAVNSKNMLHLWDVKSGQLLNYLKSEFCYFIKFSNSSKYCIIQYNKYVIQLWDIELWELKFSLYFKNDKGILHATVSPNELFLAVSLDNLIWILDIQEKKLMDEPIKEIFTLSELIFIDNRQLVTIANYFIKVWEHNIKMSCWYLVWSTKSSFYCKNTTFKNAKELSEADQLFLLEHNNEDDAESLLSIEQTEYNSISLRKSSEQLFKEVNNVCSYAYYQQGLLFLSRKNYSKAIKKFEKSVKFDSTFELSYADLAWIYFKEGIIKSKEELVNKARKNFLIAIKLDLNPITFIRYALLLIYYHEHMEAIKLLKICLKEESKSLNYDISFKKDNNDIMFLPPTLGQELAVAEVLEFNVVIIAQFLLIMEYIHLNEIVESESMLDKFIHTIFIKAESSPSRMDIFKSKITPLSCELLGYIYAALDNIEIATYYFAWAYKLDNTFQLAKSNYETCIQELLGESTCLLSPIDNVSIISLVKEITKIIIAENQDLFENGMVDFYELYSIILSFNLHLLNYFSIDNKIPIEYFHDEDVFCSAAVYHMLARIYHVICVISKERNNLQVSEFCLEKINNYFIKALELNKQNGNYLYSVIRTEYANFLMQMNEIDGVAIEKSIFYLSESIKTKNDKSIIIYSKVDRMIARTELQNSIDSSGEIYIQAPLLAHFLIIIALKFANNTSLLSKSPGLENYNILLGIYAKDFIDTVTKMDINQNILPYKLLAEIFQTLGYITEANQMFSVINYLVSSTNASQNAVPVNSEDKKLICAHGPSSLMRKIYDVHGFFSYNNKLQLSSGNKNSPENFETREYS